MHRASHALTNPVLSKIGIPNNLGDPKAERMAEQCTVMPGEPVMETPVYYRSTKSAVQRKKSGG